MEFIITLVYYLKEIIGANLDLMYFLALPFLYFSIKQKSFNLKLFIFTCTPLITFSIIQYNTAFITDSNKFIINVLKILLCIFLYVYTSENASKIDFGKLSKYISRAYAFTLPITLIFKEEPLWRLNDTINQFSETRLQLLYFEPSELSFMVSIVILYNLYFLFKNKTSRTEYIFYTLSLFYLLILSAGLGGLVNLVFALFFMMIVVAYNQLKKYTSNIALNFLKVYSIFAIFAFTLLLIYATQSSLLDRLTSIISGNDSSFNYRYVTGYNVMNASLRITDGLGVGFGNLNTEYSSFVYIIYGLTKVLANSFMYFITETGYFGLAYLLAFHTFVIYRIYKNPTPLMFKLPLLIYIITYQIAGGYFTNPINWIVYGVLCAQIESNKWLVKKFLKPLST